MKRKGFTLVELLVVIVILGIITGLSIPLVRNISQTLENRKYTTYKDSVLEASKLYVNSYSEDLFGRKEYGCSYITYNQLSDKSLIKDIDIEKVSCATNQTVVRVIKQKDKYGYTAVIGCGKKEGSGDITNIKRYPKDTVIPINHNSCTGAADNNIDISVDEKYIGGKADKKKKTTKLKLESGTGINNHISIYTAWSLDKNGYSSINSNEWAKASFEIKGDQEKKLLNGELIEVSSNQISTPSNKTGDYYLLVRVDELKDLYGSKWVNNLTVGGIVAAVRDNYISYGPFKIDNDKPTITLDLYACGANGQKSGNKIVTKTSDGSESNVIITTKDVVGSDENWLNKQAFPYGVCLDMALNDGIKVKKLEMEWNDSNLAANTANYREIKDSSEYTIGEKNANRTASILDNGHRYFVYTAKDYAGNKSNIAVDIKLDNTSPSVSCPKTNTGTTSGVIITVSCTDSVSGCKNSTSLGDHHNITTTQTYNVEDNAGNTNSCSQTVSTSNCSCQTCYQTCSRNKSYSCTKYAYNVTAQYCSQTLKGTFQRTNQSSGSGWLGTCAYTDTCTKKEYYNCNPYNCRCSTCYS